MKKEWAIGYTKSGHAIWFVPWDDRKAFAMIASVENFDNDKNKNFNFSHWIKAIEIDAPPEPYGERDE